MRFTDMIVSAGFLATSCYW